MSLAGDIAAARRWFRLCGYGPIETPDATIVATPADPDVWDANFALDKPGADPAALIAALDAAMPHSRWRIVYADVLTDPGTLAALALAGFTPGPPIIEMHAAGDIRPPHPPPPITLHTVETDDDWAAMTTLVQIDHSEGKRTGLISEAVSDGLIAAMRDRVPAGSYALIRLDGAPVGYGLMLACPGRLGLLENLFTLPEARGRGVMSAFIVEAAARLRAQGCDGIFLDALSEESAKHLYARLGFQPVALTHRWSRCIGD
ncbi:MAG: GNAT family N-acetyltransferase [Sphingomonas sp.]|nr:GNAT family N-acetyltransferase [Sphingomonas sp.]